MLHNFIRRLFFASRRQRSSRKFLSCSFTRRYNSSSRWLLLVPFESLFLGSWRILFSFEWNSILIIWRAFSECRLNSLSKECGGDFWGKKVKARVFDSSGFNFNKPVFLFLFGGNYFWDKFLFLFCKSFKVGACFL